MIREIQRDECEAKRASVLHAVAHDRVRMTGCSPSRGRRRRVSPEPKGELMRNRSFRVPARTTSVWLRSAAALTSLIAIGGCSAPPGTGADDDDGSGVPEFRGTVPGMSPAPAPAGPGAGAATSGSMSSTGSTSASGTSSGSTPSSGEQNSASGAPLAPSSSNSGSSGGMNQGAGGASMVPPSNGNSDNSGAGGASMDGADPGTPPAEPPPSNQNPPPVQPPPSQPPPAQPPPQQPPPPVTPPAAGPDIPCPADATFCSGFESDVLPDGAIYQGNPGLEFDTTVSRSGDRSVVFDAVDGFNIREVVTEIPGQAFWVRLFIQTSTTFGDNDHDSLFVASTANFQEDNNAEHGPEFSEQGNQILINADDQLFSAAGPGFPSNNQGPQLTPNVWHCVEAFFDGGSGDVQFFANGQQLIDAPGFARLTYASFRFGYLQFPGHVPHVVRYDDVVVAANRVGCN
jgi:hypothetical protein